MRFVFGVEPMRLWDRAISSSETRIYRWKQSEFHLPIVWIITSETPLEAAAVAPPMRNECVLMLLVRGKTSVRKRDTHCLVKNVPFSKQNKGPLASILWRKYVCVAATGHNVDERRNNRMIVPRRNWSVLLLRMLMSIFPASTETSEEVSVSCEYWRG